LAGQPRKGEELAKETQSETGLFRRTVNPQGEEPDDETYNRILARGRVIRAG
jgi:hypothetical protein